MKKIITIMVFVLVMLTAGVFAAEVSINDYDPKPAEAGKAMNVWFKVDNPTYDAEQGLIIEINPKDGLMVSPGEDSRKEIGILEGQSSLTVKFRLLIKDDAYKGSHTIETKLIKGNAITSKDLTIEVTDKDFKEVDLAIGDIESDPVRIKPMDDNVKLVVTVQNLGDGNAKGVKAELMNIPDGITLSESYSGTSLLGNVDADSTGTATFYIDVDEMIEAKEHVSSLKLSYKYKPDEEEDNYLTEEEFIPLRIAVKGIPIYEITETKLEPEVLTAGDKNVKVTVSIKNIGSEKGKSVRIKAYGKTEQPFDFDKSSDFIAPALEAGEEGQGTFEIDIDDDANLQRYYMDIEIKNLVNDDLIIYDKKIPITITNPLPDNPWSFARIGVGLIVLFIIYIVINKMKKKENPVAKKIKRS